MRSRRSDHCPSHAPHLVYRPNMVTVDPRTDRETLSYRPICSTERYWHKEVGRCAQYHTGTRHGQCECITAGCMVDYHDRTCVPYDTNQRKGADCKVNRGLMALCGTHMPGRDHSSGDWREACMRENGYRCRLDGEGDTACVPNHDPHGQVDVPRELSRSVDWDPDTRVGYSPHRPHLQRDDTAQIRDPEDPGRRIDVVVENILYDRKSGSVEYRVYDLDSPSVYRVSEHDIFPTPKRSATSTRRQKERELDILRRNLRTLTNRILSSHHSGRGREPSVATLLREGREVPGDTSGEFAGNTYHVLDGIEYTVNRGQILGSARHDPSRRTGGTQDAYEARRDLPSLRDLLRRGTRVRTHRSGEREGTSEHRMDGVVYVVDDRKGEVIASARPTSRSGRCVAQDRACIGEIDPISLETIDRHSVRDTVRVDKQCYDATSLQKALVIDPRVPHSRIPFTNRELNECVREGERGERRELTDCQRRCGGLAYPAERHSCYNSCVER